MAEISKNGGIKPLGSASSALPCRKLAASRKARMLTASGIELLRQDLGAALKVLGQDEVDDAHQLMRESGFRSEEFEILQHADRSPAFPSPVTGTVTVVRRSGLASKTYPAGHMSSWLMQLETDLKGGLFGSPSPKKASARS
jgi:hypothetical protein